jgi:hypothetical protein
MASLALVLSGCGLLPGGVSPYTPAPASVQDKVDCLASAGPPLGGVPGTPGPELAGSVPEGFVPVQVVRCGTDHTEVSGAYRMLIREEHLEGDFTALLAALAQPSDRANGNMACTADAEIVPALWLVNADGQAIHVLWPVDACGKTRGKPDTSKALAGLSVGKVTILTQEESSK